MKREDVVLEAKTWLGTPYHHQACVKGAGVDCAYLLIDVYSRLGLVDKIDPGFYANDWHLSKDEEKYLTWVKKHAKQVDDPKPGDIAMFKFGRCVSHGAIVVDWPIVIHSFFGQGVVLASADDAELRGRLDSFWSVFK